MPAPHRDPLGQTESMNMANITTTCNEVEYFGESINKD